MKAWNWYSYISTIITFVVNIFATLLIINSKVYVYYVCLLLSQIIISFYKITWLFSTADLLNFPLSATVISSNILSLGLQDDKRRVRNFKSR